MNDWYRLLVIAVVLAVHYFLSTRDKWYWGAVLPILYIVSLTYFQLSQMVEWSVTQLILFIIFGELFLLGNWVTCRKVVDDKRKKELARMKAYDI